MIDVNALVFSALFLPGMASIIAGVLYPPKKQKDVYIKVAMVYIPIIVLAAYCKIVN